MIDQKWRVVTMAFLCFPSIASLWASRSNRQVVCECRSHRLPPSHSRKRKNANGASHQLQRKRLRIRNKLIPVAIVQPGIFLVASLNHLLGAHRLNLGQHITKRS